MDPAPGAPETASLLTKSGLMARDPDNPNRLNVFLSHHDPENDDPVAWVSLGHAQALLKKLPVNQMGFAQSPDSASFSQGGPQRPPSNSLKNITLGFIGGGILVSGTGLTTNVVGYCMGITSNYTDVIGALAQGLTFTPLLANPTAVVFGVVAFSVVYYGWPDAP